MHAHVTRPYSHSLSDDEKLYQPRRSARRTPAAIRSRRSRSSSSPKESRATQDLAAIHEEIDKQIDEDARTGASPLRKPEPQTRAAAGSTRPTSIRRRPPFDTPSEPEGKPDTMVDLHQRTLQRRDGARTRASSCSARTSRTPAARPSLGEVKGKGGVFKVTHGLQRLYGDDRVFNSPLAEANIVGRAIGMAMRGLKPVVEIQFFDYIWPAMMQIRDELVDDALALGQHLVVPGRRSACRSAATCAAGGSYHTQSGESIFAHCPGIRVVFPSNALDATGLLRTAIRCDDPVLFLEHKHLYRQTYNKGEYPGPDFMIPFGKARLVARGQRRHR